MKSNKLILLTLVGLMGLFGCNNNQTSSISSSQQESSQTSSSSVSSVISSNESSSSSITSIDKRSSLEKALEKDYSNMTVEVVSVYDRGEQEESYYEFYYNDYTIVYTPEVAEMGYDPYTYFHDYNGLNYQYFEADRPNDPTSKAAWMNKGRDDSINYALEYIYFDMDVLLKNIDPSTAVYQGGMYIIASEDIVSKLDNTVFYTFFFNYIEYVALMVGDDGYLSQVIGLQEIDNDDDFVQIKFNSFGTTEPACELPEKPSETNIMEYWQYKGWDGPYTEKYVDSITLTPKKELENNKLVMDIEDVEQATYTFTPVDANQAKDWRLHSTNENVAKINFDYDDADGNKYVKITAVGAGDAEVYIKARGVDGIDTGVESNRISVHVNPIKDQNLEGIKYDLSFTGIDSEGNLGVTNAEANTLPVSATTTKASINSGNSDLFGNAMTLLLNPSENGVGPASVTFDFSDQQVSSISLYYGLYWPADKSNMSYIRSFTLDTSNDGQTWASIDLKDEILNNISADNFKLLEKEFAPASKVRISLESGFVGKAFRFAFNSIAFMANSNCHDHVDIVEVPVESVSISTTTTTLKTGKSITVGYVINPSDATDKTLTWHSTNEEVATFTQNVLTASSVNTGTTQIYAVAANGVESNKITITVESIPQLDTRLLGTWLGDDLITRAKFTFTETNVTVEVKTSSVEDTFVLNYEEKDGSSYYFKDSSNHTLNASYRSETEIYIQANLGEVNINKYTENYSIYRYIPATSLTLSCEKTTLNVGDSTTINISFTPNNATGVGVNDEITWVADKPGIVEFNDTTSGATGLYIRAVAAGTVTITATNGDGVSNSITITIKEPVKVSSITLTSETGTNELEVNATMQLTATITGENGETPANSSLTWKSSDSSIASVSKNGLVTGISASDDVVTITATAQDGSGVYATFEVKVIGSSSPIPSDLAGTWTGTDSTMGYDISITISTDGSLEMDIGGIETISFTLVNVSGTSYTFNDDLGNVLEVTFDPRFPDEASFNLNEGEMSYDEYITITPYDDPYTKN